MSRELLHGRKNYRCVALRSTRFYHFVAFRENFQRSHMKNSQVSRICCFVVIVAKSTESTATTTTIKTEAYESLLLLSNKQDSINETRFHFWPPFFNVYCIFFSSIYLFFVSLIFHFYI